MVLCNLRSCAFILGLLPLQVLFRITSDIQPAWVTIMSPSRFFSQCPIILPPPSCSFSWTICFDKPLVSLTPPGWLVPCSQPRTSSGCLLQGQLNMLGSLCEPLPDRLGSTRSLQCRAKWQRGHQDRFCPVENWADSAGSRFLSAAFDLMDLKNVSRCIKVDIECTILLSLHFTFFNALLGEYFSICIF